jgi:hypothetical protein
MKAQAKAFALCVDNSDYLASLILGKVYRILSDPTAGKDDLVRIVDEGGEDYSGKRSTNPGAFAAPPAPGYDWPDWARAPTAG